MSILVKINTVTRSDIIQESISWDRSLTKDPAILSFEIRNKGQSLPALGDAIEIEIDSVAKFTGTITSKQNVIEEGIVEKVAYEAKDGFHTFDRRLVIKAYSSQSASDIVSDIISSFTSGFTDNNVVAGAPEITTIRFNYEQPSQAMRMICNAINWDWYIDADLDVHFFPREYETAPFSITDTNGNLIYNSLEFSRDILNLKNNIYVRGGYFSSDIIEADALDKYEADGTQNTFPLVYRYKNVQVTLNGVAKTVGVDFINDPADYDVLYNYQEKLVKWPEASKPTAGQVVRVFGDAQVPLIVQAQDEASILAYGRFDHVLIDKSIESVAEAELQALAIMADYASASYEGTFKTKTEGLETGQYITINSTLRGVNDTFRIVGINARVYDSNSFIYTVKFLKSSNVTFMDIMADLLAEKRKNIVISEDEVIERLIFLTDDVAITDEISEMDATSPPYVWDTAVWDFSTWG